MRENRYQAIAKKESPSSLANGKKKRQSVVGEAKCVWRYLYLRTFIASCESSSVFFKWSDPNLPLSWATEKMYSSVSHGSSSGLYSYYWLTCKKHGKPGRD